MSKLVNLLDPYYGLTQWRKLAKLAFSPYFHLAFLHPKRGRGISRGRYRSFEEAIAKFPNVPVGYDNETMVLHYQDKLRRSDRTLRTRDYPILFHLSKLMADGAKIFDLGGNVGTHYYSYRQFLEMEKCLWTVGEVESLVKIGSRLANENGAANLTFTSELAAMAEYDILVCQGSLQYFKAFPLAGVSKYPPFLLINRQPLTSKTGFVTMQNGGDGVYYPQHIYNRGEFLNIIAGLDYEIVDQWDDLEDEFMQPLQTRAVGYHGFFAARK